MGRVKCQAANQRRRPLDLDSRDKMVGYKSVLVSPPLGPSKAVKGRQRPRRLGGGEGARIIDKGGRVIIRSARKRLLLKGWALKGGAFAWRWAASIVLTACWLALLPDLLFFIVSELSGAPFRSVYAGGPLEGSLPHQAALWLLEARGGERSGPSGWTGAILAGLPLMLLTGLVMGLVSAASDQAKAVWEAGEAEHQKMGDAERRALADREALEGLLPKKREKGSRRPGRPRL